MSNSVQIGLQMYTVRDKAAEDMSGALNAVAKCGYHGVELAGFQGLGLNELDHVLKSNQLELVSAHVGYGELCSNTDEWCRNLKALCAKRVTIPHISGPALDGEGLAKTAAEINRIQKVLSASGIELSFHNHHQVFENGRLDRFMESCPELKIELDTYWAAFADVDPVSLMKRLGDRLTLIHIKDMLPEVQRDRSNPDAPNPNILEGVIDIKAILDQAAEQGVAWAIVEMDIPIGDSMEAVRVSRHNLIAEGF